MAGRSFLALERNSQRCSRFAKVAFALWLVLTVASACLRASPPQTKQIDPKKSIFTIHVGKSGLFPGLGHEHLVEALIESGSLTEGPNAGIQFTIDARKMKVRPEKDQAQVQRTMQKSVLESDKYPKIVFKSIKVVPSGQAAYQVSGNLTLHGVTKNLKLRVRLQQGAFLGSTTLRQTDFNIKPVTVAGGMVKVKNEIEIAFVIHVEGKP